MLNRYYYLDAVSTSLKDSIKNDLQNCPINIHNSMNSSQYRYSIHELNSSKGLFNCAFSSVNTTALSLGTFVAPSHSYKYIDIAVAVALAVNNEHLTYHCAMRSLY